MPALLSVPATADEFATIPVGDSIYNNLSNLARFAPGRSGARRSAAILTRYEAALQTGRIIVALTELEKKGRIYGLGPDGSQALRELVTSLRTELRLLDVDPENALALAERAGKPASAARTSAGNTPDFSARTTRRNLTPLETNASRNDNLSSWLRNNAGEFSSVQIGLSPRLRAGAALLAMQRETLDPFGDSAKSLGFSRPGNAFTGKSFTNTGTAGSLSYDFNSWLSVRAKAERQSLLGASGNLGSALSAPLYSGADRASSAGGAVDLAMGPVRLSTEVSRIATDTGSGGTKVGGGVGVSAWQNRLSLSAHLARLKPADSAALESTATELKVGLDVSQRLSLGMQYQGLFTEQPNNNTSRVAGGLTLNF